MKPSYQKGTTMSSRIHNQNNRSLAYPVGMATGLIVKAAAFLSLFLMADTDITFERRLIIFTIILTIGLWLVYLTQVFFGASNKTHLVALWVGFVVVVTMTVMCIWITVTGWNLDTLSTL